MFFFVFIFFFFFLFVLYCLFYFLLILFNDVKFVYDRNSDSPLDQKHLSERLIINYTRVDINKARPSATALSQAKQRFCQCHNYTPIGEPGAHQSGGLDKQWLHRRPGTAQITCVQSACQMKGNAGAYVPLVRCQGSCSNNEFHAKCGLKWQSSDGYVLFLCDKCKMMRQLAEDKERIAMEMRMAEQAKSVSSSRKKAKRTKRGK